jgi:ubiquinone/menaquinone biosynthesis C-methylase UbiE
MKLNWAERLVVNNPGRVFEQRAEIRWLQKRRPLPPGALVLEVGCGRGAGAGMILREFQADAVYAMDLDWEMIKKAGNYLTSRQQERIFLHTGDVTHLPYRDGVFDAVFGFGVLHHVPDWRRGLAELARVLKAGGSYYLEELYPTLYQNFITKHILLHPTENRFTGGDLKTALDAHHLLITDALEYKLVGILAVLMKTA